MAHPSVQPREMWMCLRFGELEIDVAAEGVSYSPDVVDDMLAHLLKGFGKAIEELRAQGVIADDFVEDDEDAEEEPETSD